jgi:2-C-methyl-D-erythritol 2,4-cyclodiphosphate synthase
MNIRVGFGYDVHQLKRDHKFALGGITIKSDFGAVGHSDGDALIHAICDALLGAASLRDIGFHFPDTSDEYRDIDSKIILARTVDLLKEHGYTIGNIDTTICLESPKISSLIPEMQEVLSKTIGISKENLSIKATTSEKLGFVGKGKGIAVFAVALIRDSAHISPPK